MRCFRKSAHPSTWEFPWTRSSTGTSRTHMDAMKFAPLPASLSMNTGTVPQVYRASYPPVFGFRVACGASQPMAASGSESVVGR